MNRGENTEQQILEQAKLDHLNSILGNILEEGALDGREKSEHVHEEDGPVPVVFDDDQLFLLLQLLISTLCILLFFRIGIGGSRCLAQCSGFFR